MISAKLGSTNFSIYVMGITKEFIGRLVNENNSGLISAATFRLARNARNWFLLNDIQYNSSKKCMKAGS